MGGREEESFCGIPDSDVRALRRERGLSSGPSGSSISWADMLQPIPPEALPAFHDTPVFSSRYGWAMVNAIEGELLFASGMRLSLADVTEVYVLPPAFATPGAAVSMPLRRDELTGYDCVWVEPISMDAALRDELRGWYHIKKRFVENEVGQRFYFDFYGAKWLAFANGPGNI